ncbi:LacI family DNA-binding transcriptional regulator [Cellulomonas alba]|uniref:LacI family DNA-binding transcriptional regulator n=1 Tax=Cellulomonas alba TaxID=3053467 RepID=A0ABT7SGK9_9CELL|nr:LacI family DNA-binding transcriptional regulator [Cellulomonas alba]MDM7854654.1 LacI family DNA-binding transcriptional regulator [Cellulomonas alba]
MPERAPTLRDVAERSGVAVSTASRALTRPGRVNQATADRVLAAARDLGYSVSPAGRALSSGRTGTVALVVPDITNPFFFGIVRGTQARLREGGYVHVLVDTEESVEAEERTLRTLRRSVDGMILAASRLDDESLAAWSREVPIVTINRSFPGLDCPSVTIDTPGGAVQGLEHLASLGHTRVAYAGGPRTSWSDGRRRSALAEASPRLGVEVVGLGPYAPQREAGAAAADAAVASGATGILAFNDLLAFGILERLASRGVDVPGDVSVVGCDDVFGADLVRPSLTTVAAPLEKAGHHAAELLLAALDPVHPRAGAPVELGTHLVVRDSSGPAPR